MGHIVKGLYLAILCLFCIPAFAQGHAHVHGIASLEIAVDGATLTLRFESPLDSLLGFEHAPRNEKEKAAVRAMADSLGKPETHFVPTPAAACAVVSTRLDSPLLNPAAADQKPAAKADAKQSEKKKPDHSHDKQAHKDEHAELTATYVFRCERPDGLQNIEVKLFDQFRRLQRVDARVVSARGQKSVRLTTKQRRLAW